jgi:3-hydroxyisobutyrate dehydrogenase-like beta-hydroxyacid dehydrogenase
MAQNFLQAGHKVTIYNRSPEKLANLQKAGATVASTPKLAAEGQEIVMAMVRDNEASKTVWLGEEGAIEGLSAHTITIESSTLTPEWVKELSEAVSKTGSKFLEAPVLGTRPQAEAAKLIYLIGGESSLLEEVRPILEATSGAIHHIGSIGQAAAMKLAVNSQFGVQVAIWAETLTLLEKQGIEMNKAVELLNTLPTTALAMQVMGKLMAEKKFAPLFPIELVEKDFGYTVEISNQVELEANVLKTVREVYAQAKTQGYGNDNIVGILQMYQ